MVPLVISTTPVVESLVQPPEALIVGVRTDVADAVGVNVVLYFAENGTVPASKLTDWFALLTATACAEDVIGL